MARVDRHGDVAAGAATEQKLEVGRVTEQAKTRRRSTKAEQRAETMEQILDEAEYLFSKHGLHGVTLKDVAKRVEGALHAFLDTDLDLYIHGGEGWKNYGALGAQVANTPEWGAELMDSHFDPVVLRLIDLLKRALPDCAEEDIFWGYHFVTGALMVTLARTGRIDKLSGGVCKSEDFEAIKARMASFMAAGFLQICKKKA